MLFAVFQRENVGKWRRSYYPKWVTSRFFTLIWLVTISVWHHPKICWLFETPFWYFLRAWAFFPKLLLVEPDNVQVREYSFESSSKHLHSSLGKIIFLPLFGRQLTFLFPTKFLHFPLKYQEYISDNTYIANRLIVARVSYCLGTADCSIASGSCKQNPKSTLGNFLLNVLRCTYHNGKQYFSRKTLSLNNYLNIFVLLH